ncbi:STAS/SEC14 domain-containing protein [Bradyrhizobium sp. Pa8]|uniref:STAS/SEC14 domain-containing protein n=1 Tax=Bradyrhizobium sp. Pa8 TaxID=3386552 RepID=UPI00403F427F
MIDIDSTLEDGVVTVHFRGAVTNREFIDLAATIADSGSMGGTRMYLDWLEIDRWAFSVPTANDVIGWCRARKMIARVAIVHQPRLNRQAAWLAAFLREEGVEVRSWRPHSATAAAAWLRMSGPARP